MTGKLREVLARLAEIKAQAEAASPGPWRWRKSRGGSAFLSAEVCGQLLILDAVRHGMQGAELRFGVRTPSDVGGIMHKANELDLGVHPDAAFLAASRRNVPDMAEALAEARELLQAALVPLPDLDARHALLMRISEALGK